MSDDSWQFEVYQTDSILARLKKEPRIHGTIDRKMKRIRLTLKVGAKFRGTKFDKQHPTILINLSIQNLKQALRTVEWCFCAECRKTILRLCTYPESIWVEDPYIHSWIKALNKHREEKSG